MQMWILINDKITVSYYVTIILNTQSISFSAEDAL